MDELVTADDYEDILRWHYDMEKDEHEMMMRPTCAPHYYRIVPQQNRGLDREDKLKRRSLKFSTGGAKGCLAGQLICLITAEGEVFPCSYFPRSAGNVLKQSPAAGFRVARSSKVNLTVSTRRIVTTRVSVPNVVGMQEGAANATLRGAGLQVGTVTKTRGPRAGSVLTQSPSAFEGSSPPA